jgi:hypothetical protein
LWACQIADSEEKRLFTDMSELCWQNPHLWLVYCLTLLSILNIALPFLLSTYTWVYHPQAFSTYFPMWCVGYRLPMWSLGQCFLKCTCFALALCSLTDTKLGQFTYILTVLMGYCVFNVAFQKCAFKSELHFVLEEVSALVVVVSLGFGSWYMYMSHEDNPRNISITICFCLLNGGYFLWCFALMYRGKAGIDPVSASQSSEESGEFALRVPENSLAS